MGIHLRAALRLDFRGQAEVIDMMVGENDLAEVGEGITLCRQARLQRRARVRVFGPGVDQRQLFTFGKINIHRPDGKGRGHGNAMKQRHVTILANSHGLRCVQRLYSVSVRRRFNLG